MTAGMTCAEIDEPLDRTPEHIQVALLVWPRASMIEDVRCDDEQSTSARIPLEREVVRLLGACRLAILLVPAEEASQGACAELGLHPRHDGAPHRPDQPVALSDRRVTIDREPEDALGLERWYRLHQPEPEEPPVADQGQLLHRLAQLQ